MAKITEMIVDTHTVTTDKASITDIFGRTFKTLRISLTNTCNLACTYCVSPTDAIASSFKTVKKTGLSNPEFAKLISGLNNLLELETIRLTGGEPLLYKQIVPLIAEIKKTGIAEIKMTSNATLLANKAKDLKDAGLSSINISLDAMDADVSYTINRSTKTQKILDGIEKAIQAGLKVKINCVVMKGVNHHQIIPLLQYCEKNNISIRFLELMQMGHLHENFEQLFFSEKEILNTIAAQYNLTTQPRTTGATANYWKTNTGYSFGIISNVSNPFCNDCNRLRLDSYGNIYGCLSDNSPINISDCIDNQEKLKEKLFQALLQKKTKFSGSKLSMLHIGG